MINDMQIPVMLGAASFWATENGAGIQVKTLAQNDETVVFTGIPADDNYGYVLFCDNATSATPGTKRPTRTDEPDFVLGANGFYTVTYHISKVTAAQAGATCSLLIVR